MYDVHFCGMHFYLMRILGLVGKSGYARIDPYNAGCSSPVTRIKYSFSNKYMSPDDVYALGAYSYDVGLINILWQHSGLIMDIRT